MEEDTGKTSHVGAGGRIHSAEHALVDYNRSGVPLVEIVSEPDIRSAAQARAYVGELRGVLVATGASDGRMEEGSMRVDANVSMRRRGEAAFGTRCEIKNLNSLRSLGRALEYEAARQVAVIEAGDHVSQNTLHWDEEAGRTHVMRSKEEANDYRYFLEPDLVPLAPDAAWRERVLTSLGPLPAERRAELVVLLGTDPAPTAAEQDQVTAVVDQGLDGLVVAAAVAGVDPRLALKRAANEVAADLDAGLRLPVEAFAALCALEGGGKLSSTQARDVLARLLSDGGGDPAALAAEMGFEALSGDAVADAVAAAIDEHPDEWGRYVEGEDKLTGFFTGLVMKATRGKADGKAVAAELRRRRGS
jgi:aspartyl-tRNA(Asn)/glutamyl-tRNA(Gln) amidotransferase subunit B